MKMCISGLWQHRGRHSYDEFTLSGQIALANAGKGVVASLAERRAVDIRRKETYGCQNTRVKSSLRQAFVASILSLY
jgi:hypothetical protein